MSLSTRVLTFGLGALTYPIVLEVTTRLLGRSVLDPTHRRKEKTP